MHDRPVMAMIARGQQLRPSAESFQSLITDLSTGLTTTICTFLDPIKKVDKQACPSAKTHCSKNNHTPESLGLQGFQRATPTLFTASSTANGDKSKLWKNSHLQRLYVALWQVGNFVFHNFPNVSVFGEQAGAKKPRHFRIGACGQLQPISDRRGKRYALPRSPAVPGRFPSGGSRR